MILKISYTNVYESSIRTKVIINLIKVIPLDKLKTTQKFVAFSNYYRIYRNRSYTDINSTTRYTYLLNTNMSEINKKDHMCKTLFDLSENFLKALERKNKLKRLLS